MAYFGFPDPYELQQQQSLFSGPLGTNPNPLYAPTPPFAQPGNYPPSFLAQAGPGPSQGMGGGSLYNQPSSYMQMAAPRPMPAQQGNYPPMRQGAQGQGQYDQGFGYQPIGAPVQPQIAPNNQAQGGVNALTGKVFGNLFDPETMVANVLQSQGFDPGSGNPMVQAMLDNASQIIAPLFVQLANNPAAINNLPNLIQTQVTNALNGQNVFMTPGQGVSSFHQLEGAVNRLNQMEQQAVQTGGAIDPNLEASLGLLKSVLSTGNGSSNLLASLMTGGMASPIQKYIGGRIKDLPRLAELYGATHPASGRENAPSYLSLILGGM